MQSPSTSMMPDAGAAQKPLTQLKLLQPALLTQVLPSFARLPFTCKPPPTVWSQYSESSAMGAQRIASRRGLMNLLRGMTERQVRGGSARERRMFARPPSDAKDIRVHLRP